MIPGSTEGGKSGKIHQGKPEDRSGEPTISPTLKMGTDTRDLLDSDGQERFCLYSGPSGTAQVNRVSDIELSSSLEDLDRNVRILFDKFKPGFSLNLPDMTGMQLHDLYEQEFNGVVINAPADFSFEKPRDDHKGYWEAIGAANKLGLDLWPFYYSQNLRSWILPMPDGACAYYAMRLIACLTGKSITMAPPRVPIPYKVPLDSIVSWFEIHKIPTADLYVAPIMANLYHAFVAMPNSFGVR